MKIYLRHVVRTSWAVWQVLGGFFALLFMGGFVLDPGLATVLPLLALFAVVGVMDWFRQRLPRGRAMAGLYATLESHLRRQRGARLASPGGHVRFVASRSRVSKVMLDDTISAGDKGEYHFTETFILLPVRPLVLWIVNSELHGAGQGNPGPAALGVRLPVRQLFFMLRTGAGLATEADLRALLTQLREATPVDLLEQ